MEKYLISFVKCIRPQKRNQIRFSHIDISAIYVAAPPFLRQGKEGVLHVDVDKRKNIFQCLVKVIVFHFVKNADLH